MTETKGWERTRHGGLRRARTHTRAAQMNGKPGREEETETEVVATAEADVTRNPVTTKVGHHSDKVEVGGSNPSPRTRQFILKLHEPLGLPTCPYVIRWRFETPWWSIRLHHWLAPDDDRAKHDHPWNFTTFVLKGGYTDSSPEGDEHLRAPAIRHRLATHQHTVFPDPGGCWTIIVTSKKLRKWGFWVNGKFVKMNKYFLTFGHHSCE